MTRLELAGAQGLRLVADRWLPASHRRGTVVLLHGGGQTRHSWARTAKQLADEGWLSITVDARGHGESEWSPSGDYALDHFVADLYALIDTLDDRPVLVGASLGGRVALVAEGERRGVCAGLVLVDIAPRVNRDGQKRVQAFLGGAPQGFASPDEAAAAIDAFQPNRRGPRNLQGLRKNLRQRTDGRWYWHWDPKFLQFGADPDRNSPVDRLNRAAACITVPTMLVRGRESDLVSAESARELLQLIPTAELVEVDAGHMVTGDDNAVFTAHLGKFLERVRRP
ncbi:alpha/beta hydrolase [Skermania sp. ID1734]|uniref:alpha/beta fold hydrolase n=1 Tax=Skermania sp. ID1734 TaxID=2597516 RepID=UPI00117F8236|nr:alpha/beta hydrolase [Skermania sp. ID1734]TSD94085.1 alpha/beta hydrolase [Skermania sp. ID1734]